MLVAKAFGTTTALRSLEVGVVVYKGTDRGTPCRYLSHNGPKSYNPPEYAPARVFARLFGGPLPPTAVPAPTQPPPNKLGPAWMRHPSLRQSVLDVVKSDVGRLKTRLGAADRARLDRHLEGVRAIENRIALLPAGGMAAAGSPTMPVAGTCKSPTAPAATAEDLEAQSRVMNRLLALAIGCGVTRVFSNLFVGSRDDTVYTHLGVRGQYHGLTHGESGDQPQVQKIVAFIMRNFADLVIAFKETPMGAGNALDHGVIFGGTDCAEGNSHSGSDYPFVLAGKAGGALAGDTHFRSSGADQATNVIGTVVRALDVSIAFGLNDRCRPNRVITDVLA